jgi:hypothetical protein
MQRDLHHQLLLTAKREQVLTIWKLTEQQHQQQHDKTSDICSTLLVATSGTKCQIRLRQASEIYGFKLHSKQLLSQAFGELATTRLLLQLQDV